MMILISYAKDVSSYLFHVSDPCEGKGCFEDTCKDNGGNTCVCNEGLVWNADKTDCVGKKLTIFDI